MTVVFILVTTISLIPLSFNNHRSKMDYQVSLPPPT